MSDFYYILLDDTLHLSAMDGTAHVPVTSRSANIFCPWPWSAATDITKVVIDGPIQLPPDSSWLFAGLYNLTEIEGLENLDTSQVVNMSHMFEGCESLQNLNGISGWDTRNVTDMSSTFYDCPCLPSLDLSGWDVTNVADTSYAVAQCQSLSSVNLDGWNLPMIRNMSYMFDGCSNLTEVDALAQLNTGRLEDVQSMFRDCLSLKSADLSHFDMSKVKDMSRMFLNCRSLSTIKGLENWDVSNVTDMSEMFAGCKSLESIGIQSWKLPYLKARDTDSVFRNCKSLTVAPTNHCLANEARVAGVSFGDGSPTHTKSQTR